MTTDALTAALAILSKPSDAEPEPALNDGSGPLPEQTDPKALSCRGCASDLPPGWDRPCPKCRDTSREFKYQQRREIKPLPAEAEPKSQFQHAGHKSGLASAAAAAARKKMMGNPALTAAHATGKGWESKEYRLAYMDVYNRQRWAETKAKRKKENPCPKPTP